MTSALPKSSSIVLRSLHLQPPGAPERLSRKATTSSSRRRPSGVERSKTGRPSILYWDSTERHRSRLSRSGVTLPTQLFITCLLYTSDAADERSSVDLGG